MGSRRMLLTDPLDGELKTIITLLSEETALDTTSAAIRVGDAEDITIWCEYNGVVSAGEVIAESAMVEDYAGNWSNEDNSSEDTGDAVDRMTIRAIVEWIRVRIGTAIAGGGSVTVKMAVRGAVRS